MNRDKTIVFVCEHGAAKSVLAAAYFNKLAEENNLDVHAVARGTYPEPELSPATLVGLQADGLKLDESTPQRLSSDDVASAGRIISFCDLPGEYQDKTDIEYWEDIPPVSGGYEKARDAILARLRLLVAHL